jgi:hypothetical protein
MKIAVWFVGHGSAMNAVGHDAFTETLTGLGGAAAGCAFGFIPLTAPSCSNRV